ILCRSRADRRNLDLDRVDRRPEVGAGGRRAVARRTGDWLSPVEAGGSRRCRPAGALTAAWQSRKHRGHVERDPLALGPRKLELEVAREVILVPELEAMRAALDGDPAAERVERAHELAVDVDLCVAHVALDVDDRVLRGHAAGADPGSARDREPARRDQRAHHGVPALPGAAAPVAPDTVASMRSPTILTDTAVSAGGGFSTIAGLRPTDSAVATPITQPAGEPWRKVARDTPRAPTRCLISACTMPHGVVRASRTRTIPGSPTGVSLPVNAWAC